MFEKEAEEYADSKCGKDRRTTGWILTQEDFQKGAEFGYNKAKEEYEKKLTEITENCDELLSQIYKLEDRIGELFKCY